MHIAILRRNRRDRLRLRTFSQTEIANHFNIWLREARELSRATKVRSKDVFTGCISSSLTKFYTHASLLQYKRTLWGDISRKEQYPLFWQCPTCTFLAPLSLERN